MVQSSVQERGKIYKLTGENLGDESDGGHTDRCCGAAQKVTEPPVQQRRGGVCPTHGRAPPAEETAKAKTWRPRRTWPILGLASLRLWLEQQMLMRNKAAGILSLE